VEVRRHSLSLEPWSQWRDTTKLNMTGPIIFKRPICSMR
jgi:hypothetical protein